MDLHPTPRGNKTASPWTEPRLRRLVDLWNDRLSAAGIARALGPEFSRSAVVGKLLRLGLRRTDEQRQDAQSAGARHSHVRQRVAGLHPSAMPRVALPPPTPCAVVPRLVGILELKRSSCRWPYEVGGEMRFCGHQARAESPYCPDHYAIAYLAVLPPLTLEEIEAADRRRRSGVPNRPTR
jgi:GcrA cell cycle regulator